jgi:hypothetical protein
MSNNSPPHQGSFWTTIPGVITAVATLITAVGGLLIALHTLPQRATSTPTSSDFASRDGSRVTSTGVPGSEPTIKQELITLHKTADSKYSSTGDTFRVEYFYQITNANTQDVDCRVEFTCIKGRRDNTDSVLERYESRVHSIVVKAGATEDITGFLRCYGYNDAQGLITLQREIGDCSAR